MTTTSSSPSRTPTALSPSSTNNCSATPADNVHETVRHYALMPLTPLILLTNIAVLLLAAHRHSRRPDLLLIASLCCADIMVGGASIATLVTQARETTLSGCLVRVGLSLSAVQASIFTLMAVAFDRLLAIVYALR